jgi:hypothetical protein
VKNAEQITSEDILASDLIWGIGAIALHIGRTPRQTAYLIEKGKLPVKRLGARTIAARKSELSSNLSSQKA